jgi:hypothetical protein
VEAKSEPKAEVETSPVEDEQVNPKVLALVCLGCGVVIGLAIAAGKASQPRYAWQSSHDYLESRVDRLEAYMQARRELERDGRRDVPRYDVPGVLS